MIRFRDFIAEAILKDEHGKPMRFYHGTTKDFTEFEPHQKRGMQLGFGIHFTTDPELANHYAGKQKRNGEMDTHGGNVHVVYLDVKKAFDQEKMYSVNDPEYEFAKELYKGTGRPLIVSKDSEYAKDAGGKFVVTLDATSPERAVRILRKYGYDAVWYNAKVTSRAAYGQIRTHMAAQSIVVLDKSQVRSALASPVPAE